MSAPLSLAVDSNPPISPSDVVGYAVSGPETGELVGDGTFPVTGLAVGSFVKIGFVTGCGVLLPHSLMTLSGQMVHPTEKIEARSSTGVEVGINASAAVGVI